MTKLVQRHIYYKTVCIIHKVSICCKNVWWRNISIRSYIEYYSLPFMKQVHLIYVLRTLIYTHEHIHLQTCTYTLFWPAVIFLIRFRHFVRHLFPVIIHLDIRMEQELDTLHDSSVWRPIRMSLQVHIRKTTDLSLIFALCGVRQYDCDICVPATSFSPPRSKWISLSVSTLAALVWGQLHKEKVTTCSPNRMSMQC